MQATPVVAPAADVRFVPEMEPLPGVTEAALAITPGVRMAFDAAWERARPAVAARVNPAALAEISRWAKEQTAGAPLSPGWLDALPMDPMGRTDAGLAVFGQSAEQSTAVLPSHSPLVRRRLIVAPVFDPATRTIPIVFVTIRGWAEE